MMIELKPEQFKNAAALFEGFPYSLSIHAAIEGNNPGRIFVDNVNRPRTAFALTVEGYLLAGDPTEPATVQRLQQLLKEKIFTGKVYVNGDWSLSLAVHPASWEALLTTLIPGYDVEKVPRYHYLCRKVRYDWQDHLPPGYPIRQIDRALLETHLLNSSEALEEWLDIPELWWTVEDFLEKGVGFCALYEGQVVAVCSSDCVAGDQIDVGVFTDPAHRRLGLASAVVAATCEHCLSHGFHRVGWHCNAQNTASWKTAEKVGFERDCEYAYYYYIYDPVDHLAELGWHHYQLGEYERTTAYYEQVFAQREQNPDYYYHLAALAWAELGDRGKATHYLQAAVRQGWRQVEWTRQQAAFKILQGTPEWESILSQMQQNAK